MKWDELDEDSDSCLEDRGHDQSDGAHLPSTITLGPEQIRNRDALYSLQSNLRNPRSRHVHLSDLPVRAWRVNLFKSPNGEAKSVDNPSANPGAMPERFSRMRRAGKVVISAVHVAVKGAVVNASPIKWARDNIQIQKRIRFLGKARQSFLFSPGDVRLMLSVLFFFNGW
jgi:hypothetical protein